MFNVYFNKNLIKDSARNTFLTPILGIYKYGGKGTVGDEYLFYDKNQLKEWGNKGKDIIKYTTIENCDFCVYPKNYYMDCYKELKEEAKKAKKYHKKIVVFSDTDVETPIPYIENMIVFRTSINNKSPNYEFSYPDFISPIVIKENNYEHHNDISIGYCGYGGTVKRIFKIWNYIRNTYLFNKIIGFILYNELFDKILSGFDRFCIEPYIKKNSLAFRLLQYNKGMIVRGNVISQLQNSKYKFNYKKRDKVLNPNVLGNSREEYIENIRKSTFIMVTRGHGNHAYRLYETMSAHKIPLFIDTYSRLPLENIIDYKSLFLRIPYEKIDKIDEYIDEYLIKHKHELGKIEEKFDIYIKLT